tara:strand:- start:14593 stop:14919 length:327 start_codon:yes stop_codon:yes gene_type:complete
MITLSEKAQLKLSSMAPNNDKFRFSVDGAGCAGFIYKLDYCEDNDESDEELDFVSFKIYIDNYSQLYLFGSHIDYNDSDLMNQGFVFSNPNAASSCRCGISFSLKEDA